VTPRAYYSEWDKDAAAWLRGLIAAGLIMDGDVDERSISDVKPTDLAGYVQCHFFGGISGWPLALQLAGWSDDKPCWTGSCPCQSFSTAGKRRGRYDPRHLWPKWCRLIAECQPPVVIGEQVASADTIGPAASKAGGGDYPQPSTVWVDGVQASLEGAGYAFGFHVLGAHSVGADHIRQRVYWLADAERADSRGGIAGEQGQSERGRAGLADYGEPGGVADGGGEGLARRAKQPAREERQAAERSGEPGGVGHSESNGRDARRAEPGRLGGTAVPGGEPGGVEHADERGRPCGERSGSGDNGRYETPQEGDVRSTAPDAGPWSDFILIPCRDNKVRRACPRIPVMAARIPRNLADLLPRLAKLGHDPKAAGRIVREARRHRVAALRGAGNSIVPPLAAEFIRAAMEAMKEIR